MQEAIALAAGEHLDAPRRVRSLKSNFGRDVEHGLYKRQDAICCALSADRPRLPLRVLAWRGEAYVQRSDISTANFRESLVVERFQVGVEFLLIFLPSLLARF